MQKQRWIVGLANKIVSPDTLNEFALKSVANTAKNTQEVFGILASKG